MNVERRKAKNILTSKFEKVKLHIPPTLQAADAPPHEPQTLLMGCQHPPAGCLAVWSKGQKIPF